MENENKAAGMERVGEIAGTQVPMGCTCGDPRDLGVLHRSSGPCYVKGATSQVEAATSEVVAWLLEDQGCRAPDDCEEFERVVLAKDIAPDELARFRKAGRAHALAIAADLVPVPDTAAVRASALKEAAKHITKKAEDYHNEHGSQESDTGSWNYPGDGQDYINTLEELVEEIEALSASPALPVTEKLLPVGGNQVGMATMRDLAMLLQRMGRALLNAVPDSPLPAQAMDYLKRKGLQGSPLRDESATEQAKPEPIFPPMPHAVYRHPKLGELFDRMQMHFYAVKYSDGLSRVFEIAAQAKPDLSGLTRWDLETDHGNTGNYTFMARDEGGEYIRYADVVALLAHPVVQAKPEGGGPRKTSLADQVKQAQAIVAADPDRFKHVGLEGSGKNEAGKP